MQTALCYCAARKQPGSKTAALQSHGDKVAGSSSKKERRVRSTGVLPSSLQEGAKCKTLSALTDTVSTCFWIHCRKKHSVSTINNFLTVKIKGGFHGEFDRNRTELIIQFLTNLRRNINKTAYYRSRNTCGLVKRLTLIWAYWEKLLTYQQQKLL